MGFLFNIYTSKLSRLDKQMYRQHTAVSKDLPQASLIETALLPTKDDVGASAEASNEEDGAVNVGWIEGPSDVTVCWPLAEVAGTLCVSVSEAGLYETAFCVTLDDVRQIGLPAVSCEQVSAIADEEQRNAKSTKSMSCRFNLANQGRQDTHGSKNSLSNTCCTLTQHTRGFRSWCMYCRLDNSPRCR